MIRFYVACAITFCDISSGCAQPLLTPQEEQLAAEGRRQTDLLKSAFRQRQITLLQYYQRYYQIDRDYFKPPPLVTELDLYNIMMAKNVELGKITQEEFDYYQQQKIQEIAKRMTTFD